LNLHRETQNCENLILSIVTVSYNDLARLQHTIDSLITVRLQFEHIVVVPSSDFRTRDWLEANHGEPKSKIRVVLDNGKGIYEAMNLGISHARGKFICFWNSGDLLSNQDNLKSLIETLSSSTESWLVCKANLQWMNSASYNSSSMYDFLIGKPKNFISHQAVIIDRLKLVTLGLFNTKYRVAADTDLLIRSYYEFGEPGQFMNEVVYVQTPQFAATHNRRSRIEILKITFAQFKFTDRYKALSHLFIRELSVLPSNLLRNT
jgi:glycosyltransferase involved in cell wall biosynthesis